MVAEQSPKGHRLRESTSSKGTTPTGGAGKAARESDPGEAFLHAFGRVSAGKSRLTFLHESDEGLRRDHSNRTERVERQHVCNARDDISRLAAERQLQELVVLWVAALLNRLRNLNQHSVTHERRQELQTLFLPHIPVEFRTP